MIGRTVRESLVVSILVLLVCACGCDMLQKPSAEIAGMKVQNVSLTEATMLFDVKVGNPYSVPLPLGNLDYALSSQGQEFVSGKADVQGTVPANSRRIWVRGSVSPNCSAVKGCQTRPPFRTRPTWAVRERAAVGRYGADEQEGEPHPTPESGPDQGRSEIAFAGWSV